jgi:ribulose bisphosphate carboxylase small subunit
VALVAVAEEAPLDAFALETGTLDDAFRCDVSDAHVRLHAIDSVRERVVDRGLHRPGRDAAPARPEESQ